MKRFELTLPLRVGPWWFGMLMIVPLLPLIVCFPLIDAFVAFGRSAKEQVLDLCDAIEVIWADRKRPDKVYSSESEKPGWSGPGELIP